MAFDGLVVLCAATVADLWQRPYRVCLDKAGEGVTDHAVCNSSTRMELLCRRRAFSVQGEHDLDCLLVPEQRSGSAACLSWAVHLGVYRSE